MQAFWDPEPKNDDSYGTCIWCLGKKYASQPPLNLAPETEEESADNGGIAVIGEEHIPKQISERIQPSAPNGFAPKQSVAMSPEGDAERGWPPDFLNDCESRLWFTYRSNFPAIKKSSEASMTLSVRLRSLGEQAGFTSDTGWGCMIRSGQSLLANALVMLRLGRGILSKHGFQRV